MMSSCMRGAGYKLQGWGTGEVRGCRLNIPEEKYWALVVLATRGQTDILKNHAEIISSQTAGTCLPQTFRSISHPLLDRARQGLDPAHRPYVSSDLVHSTVIRHCQAERILRRLNLQLPESRVCV